MRAWPLLVVTWTTGCGQAAPARPDGGSLTWEAVTQLKSAPYLAEAVAYRSDGKLVRGLLCRPTGAGPYPVLVANHGGFSGLSTELSGEGPVCSLAAQGWVVVQASYRGEDGSAGEIEVCAGEATDVLAMLDIVRAQAYADRARVAMWGASHGGCITLRALQRDAPVAAAAAVFGPADWAHVYWTWKQAAMSDPEGYGAVLAILEHATRGTPDGAPSEYAARSPLSYVAELDRFAGAVLLVHGNHDLVVPVVDTCRLAARAQGFASYRVADGAVIASPPPECQGEPIAWQSGPIPAGAWPGKRYLVEYDGAGHDFASSPAEIRMNAAAWDFLFAKVPVER